MISIEILSSPDKEKLGKITFQYNAVSIGSSFQCHLMIDDLKMRDMEIVLKIENEEIFFETIEKSFVVLQEKIFRGRKALSKRDKIKFGDTFLEIVDFSLEKVYNVIPLKDTYDLLLKNHPEQENLIEEMEKELSNIENPINPTSGS